MHAGKDIVGYWEKATKNDDRNDGIDVTWDGQTRDERTSNIGTYMMYTHTFPPKSEFPDSHVRALTENVLDDVLFYSDGTQYPNGEYNYLTEYKIYVKEDPNKSSSSSLKNEGIIPVKASDYLSGTKIKEHKFGANDTIFVDTNPNITVVREGSQR